MGSTGGFRLSVFDRKLRDLACEEMLDIDAILQRSMINTKKDHTISFAFMLP